jgi:glycosyltransferase involved in cell wall biosynthesis
MTAAEPSHDDGPDRPRNVLVVMPSLRRGGAERHAVLMVTTLDRSRWTPHVLAFADGPLKAELERAGIAVTVATTGSGLRSVPAASRVIAEMVERLDPAVVSGHDVFVELAARAVARRRPLPLLVWKHTYGHIGYRGRRERLIESVSGRLVTRYGAVCHTQVRYLIDQLGLDPRRIRVVANTVDPDVVNPDPGAPAEIPAAPTVAMVAAMRADKGHHTALTAWAEVIRVLPDARLLLAGDGPLRAEYEALVRDLGIAASVEFLGEVADPEAVIRRSDLLVLASYTIECFPYVGLEAMALARPMISTDIGGLPEMVDDGVTGRLVPPHDPGALAVALIAALSDRAATGEQGRAARRRLDSVFPFVRWQDQVNELLTEVATATKESA